MAMGGLRVLREIQVSPSPSVPSPASQPLSFLDSIWLSAAQVERLFFYDFPHPTSRFIDFHLHTFVTSLSLVLARFYPLAGTIHRSPASDDKFEISYTEGDSVSVIIAEFTGEDFRSISGHQPRSFNKLRQLVQRPPDGKSQLLSVQVTVFPNQGLCIGLTVNHSACDGSGSMHFIRSWAAACRSPEGALDIAVPLLDRSVIFEDPELTRRLSERARRFHETLEEHLPNVKSLSPNLVSGTFSLGRDQIARLKKKVQRRTVEEVTPLSHISTFVVTCAYVLKCLVKVWKCVGGNRNIYFSSAVDWRLRMRPPVPSNYFGNCLGTCLSEALKADEIAGEDGVEVAAMAIGRCIAWLQGKEIGEVLDGCFEKYMEMVRTKSLALSVAGSPKLGVYDTDFGWGIPAKVEVLSIVETGAMALAESREEEGGVEIGLVLAEEEMDVFRRSFESGLLSL